MLDVITAPVPGRRTELESMFRLRDEIFNQRMNWDVESKDGMERDQFDGLNPIYFLAYDDSGALSGTWRLLPTTGSYMIRDVFPFLLEGEEAPSSLEIWEASRFAVGGNYSGRDGLAAVNKVTGELFCGLIEFCVLNGIEEIITAYDVRIARLLKRIDCHPFWQSGMHKIGNTTAIAGRFKTNLAVLERIRAATGTEHSAIRDVFPSVSDLAA